MARMRRSTSATSASEAPDLSTMIMIRFLSIPSTGGTKKAARVGPWRAGYSTGGAVGVSRALGTRAIAPPRARLGAEAPQDLLAIVVERQAGRAHERDEHDGVDVLLLADVRAEVRADPRAGDTPHGGDDREEPEGHRADAEQVRDDVLREARDQVEDEADDRALGLQDEVHLLPVVLAQPRADQRLAPLAAHPETEERADREADRGVDHAPQGAE